ncbi:MAG: hypothetical protein AB7P34_12075 [Vicinamibacterales bacterium]
MKTAMALFVVLALAVPASAQGVDPIRCWWQSSAGAVTIGETFNVVLTCAVIETESMQVVADESRLGVASIQMAPFEILGGSHPADAHRQQRRFFQYHYQLRLISADAIGHDVNVPALSIPYRVHSRVGAAAALEGRDLSYLMPPLPIKVLSLVPADAADIRDASDASLGAVESLRFRSSVFQILAIAFGAIGVVMAVMAVVPLVRGGRKPGAVAGDRLPDRTVAAHAARELASVQSLAAGEGWSDAAVVRGLAASRVIAALAIRHPVSEKAITAGAAVPEGRLGVVHGRLRPRRAAVSSAVTATDVAVFASRLDDSVSLTHRHHLQGLQSALQELTAALYRQAPVRDAATLDEAIRHAAEVAGDVQRERNAWSTWWSQR